MKKHDFLIELKNIILKPFLSFFLSLFIGGSLAIISSLILDSILESRGLPGAHGGLFRGGIILATLVSICGGICYGFVFGLYNNFIVRISVGTILGLFIGAWFAYGFTDNSYIQLLGVVYFIAYGSLWGALGGVIFAITIYPIFKLIKLTSSNWIQKIIHEKALIISSSISLIVAFIPILFNGESNNLNEQKVYIIVGSFSSCSNAYDNIQNIEAQIPHVIFDVRVIYTINSTYAVTIGEFQPKMAKRILITTVQKKQIPSNSFLITKENVLKDFIKCNE